MSLYKRGNVWWYEFTLFGQRYRDSTKLSNKEQARNVESAVRLSVVNGTFGITQKKKDPVPSFKDFYPEVIEALKNKSEAQHPRTVENAEQLLGRLIRFKPLANARLDQINDEMLTKFVTWHRTALTPNKQKYSNGSINKSLATIRATLRLAVEREKISRAPNVSRYMLEERSREFVLTGEQREEFLGGLPEPCRTVARFLMDTGLRISECCELMWERVLIDESRDLMFIYVMRGKTKKAKRYIALTPEAREIIEGQRKISRSNYVFVRVGDRVDKELWYVAPLSRHTLSHQFRDRRREMGLPDDAVLHSTRHTYLTELGASGADAFTIKAIAGHASVTTSEKYIHPISDTLVRAVERLSASRKRDQDASRARLEVAGKVSAKNVPTISPTVDFKGIAAAAK